MVSFPSFKWNAKPTPSDIPSDIPTVENDARSSTSEQLADIKEINAHALYETSTLENEGGAAVEVISPLGRNLGWTSAFFINVRYYFP